MSSDKKKETSIRSHESQIIHKGQMIKGNKMSQDEIDEILPLISHYHTVPPTIIDAYFGSNFYTIILREDDGIYQETYQFFSDELTQIFRVRMDGKKYDYKKFLYIIPSAAFFYLATIYGGSNLLLSIVSIGVAAVFFFKAVSRS